MGGGIAREVKAEAESQECWHYRGVEKGAYKVGRNGSGQGFGAVLQLGYTSWKVGSSYS